ncbi:ABC transporter permease [Candidatus Saccharibacteria bacterium]|nr:ABC transporter permease [Candidatus Saccharibacteria bacterium]
MRIRHALLLAKTKFRIRRIRLSVGILVSGLLFGLAIAALSVFANLQSGLKPYLDYGINSRYLVTAQNMHFSYGANEERLQELALKYYNENKAKGLYSEEDLVFEYPIEKYANGETAVKINAKATDAAVIEIAKDQNNYDINDARGLAEKVGAKYLHHYSAYRHLKGDGRLTSIISDEKENLRPFVVHDYYDDVAMAFGSPVYAIDDDLHRLYLKPDNYAANTEIPVLIDEKTWQDVHQDTIEFCYRDAEAIDYTTRALNGEDGFKLQNTACTHPDGQKGRTARIKFRVVGIYPTRSYGDSADNISDLVHNIAKSGLGGGVVVLLDQLTAEQKILLDTFFTDEKTLFDYQYNKDWFIFEFATPEQAKQFWTDFGCEEPICPADTPFSLDKSSNNAVLMSDIFDKLRDAIVLALAVIIMLSAIILMSILNRIVADSQKENAIFTAIGYTKGSLMKVYFVYTLIYALLVGVIACIIGVALPLVGQNLVGARISEALNGLFHTPSNYAIDLGAPTIFVAYMLGCIIAISIVCVVPVLALKINRKTLRRLRE